MKNRSQELGTAGIAILLYNCATDNAAMIAGNGPYVAYVKGDFAPYTINAIRSTVLVKNACG